MHSPRNSAAMRQKIAPALLVRESASLVHLSNQKQSNSMANLQVLPKPPIQPIRFVLRCGSDPSFCSRCSLVSAFTVRRRIPATQTLRLCISGPGCPTILDFFDRGLCTENPFWLKVRQLRV